jgi:hypothetical protein
MIADTGKAYQFQPLKWSCFAEGKQNRQAHLDSYEEKNNRLYGAGGMKGKTLLGIVQALIVMFSCTIFLNRKKL